MESVHLSLREDAIFPWYSIAQVAYSVVAVRRASRVSIQRSPELPNRDCRAARA